MIRFGMSILVLILIVILSLIIITALVLGLTIIFIYLFSPNRNEFGEIDECYGCKKENCYDIDHKGTVCNWKNKMNKEMDKNNEKIDEQA